ncbi:chitobiosyldiphosphodolichol beta-mannosyltransferase [Delitschia confertaspora ATCC 74209]|uniref:Chitobiosyldiphosphodolichol beta-mannosyltransferase n=1 Tax=Delitschia confertaspora ATCC 74209 TaxID=1513339 RepID=A0A9P4JFK5_9PLEO|nr:chitobiosyldiphosphodolichol beta-mannosyltransferase [Delitschia confertaspora ATCC 74209]
MLDNYIFQLVLFLAVILSSLFTLVLITLPSQYNICKENVETETDEKKLVSKGKTENKTVKAKQGKTVQVVVLGDIGRSPRMQYHAISIAKHGGSVQLIGYKESEIHPDIVFNPLIKIMPLTPSPSFLHSSSNLLFPIVAPLKALWQAFSLYYALGYETEPSRWMLVQNPPSIPTLAIAQLICFLRNTHLVIDWHNFGYSILAMKLGPNHPLVKIASLYENIFSRSAAFHFTVTHAMARVLSSSYGVTALPLHDRPAELFRPISWEQRKQFLSGLEQTKEYADEICESSSLHRSPGWKLIVSSTSWTADEDFSILLDALCAYSAAATSKVKLPKILAIITGKGPMKDYYLERVAALNQEKRLLNVVIQTAWLTPSDYALLLASADLGISLHTSSSGVDLPMKVVDMFGAGLPVVGWGKFEAWPELVKQDVNGKGFESSEQLCQQLVELFEDKDGKLLGKLKDGALEESKRRWDEEWDRVGGKLFKLT